jgi:hypothetical protein
VGSDPVTDQIPEPPEIEAGEGVPSDNTTLVDVMDRYQAAGFDAQFGAAEGGKIHCFACGAESPPERAELVSLRRMEGASDPADMMAVVALRCPSCHAGGVLALGYGPESTAGDADLLVRLEDLRGTETPDVPADAAPGEVAEASE